MTKRLRGQSGAGYKAVMDVTSRLQTVRASVLRSMECQGKPGGFLVGYKRLIRGALEGRLQGHTPFVVVATEARPAAVIVTSRS